jgi:hypothetical protein
MNKKTVLLVGFGVSGLCLVKHLQDRGIDFHVVSNASQKASVVAGGLLNPVSLKRLKPVWKLEEFYPFALNFYKQHVSDYLEYTPLMRVFSSVEEQNAWFEGMDSKRLGAYLSPQLIPNIKGVNSAYQLGEVLKTAVIHLKDCLTDASKTLQKEGKFTFESFNHNELKVSEENIAYQEKTYSHVIFAEGFGVLQNPFFSWLPIYVNQGEYIHVEFKAKDKLPIVKGKHFLIPTSTQGVYKFGATYNRSLTENVTTTEAREMLVGDLKKMISIPFEVVHQEAGIRPTTKDRHPVIGVHPQFKRLAVFNGMGSRGVVCAPLLAKQLLDLMFENKQVFKEVAIDRFML